MITREDLLENLLCEERFFATYSCGKYPTCKDCHKHTLSEYEDSIRKEAIRKFAEWFAKCSKVSEPALEHTVNRWIEDYEQEMKNDNT